MDSERRKCLSCGRITYCWVLYDRITRCGACHSPDVRYPTEQDEYQSELEYLHERINRLERGR